MNLENLEMVAEKKVLKYRVINGAVFGLLALFLVISYSLGFRMIGVEGFSLIGILVSIVVCSVGYMSFNLIIDMYYELVLNRLININLLIKVNKELNK